MFKDLRSFMEALRKDKDLVEINAEVDPYLELPEIHRRVVEEGGPALLFTNPKGSSFPIVTNLYGTLRRVELAVGPKPEELVQKMAQAVDKLLPPTPSALWKERDWMLALGKSGTRKVGAGQAPILEKHVTDVDLNQLPVLTSWHEDGGPFFTLPLVYTEHPTKKNHNLGMYRMQVHEKSQTGMHFQIHKGGGFHLYEAEKLNQPLPVTVFLGGPPALTLTAISPIPDMLPELFFCSFLMGEKLEMVDVPNHKHALVANAEFALCGEVPPHVRRPEGPFGDHYGYYSLTHDFPVFNIKQMYHRKDAIFPATVVGKPRQEDYYIGEYLQRLLSPVFPLVLSGVRDLWTYAEAGFHSLTGAIVRESYYKEALAHAFRILGEGQLSLTKILIMTDQPTNMNNFTELLENVLARFKPEQDLLIINDTSMDTLDYTGRQFNRGSKAIITGLGDQIRELPREYQGGEISGIDGIKPYCGGCLLVSGATYAANPDLAAGLVHTGQAQLAQWPLVLLVDDVNDIKDQTSFLWTVFTRFDPAHDIYAASEVVHNKIKYHGPIVIDSRMKPQYPDDVTPQAEIVNKVSARWKEYFGTKNY